MSNQVINFNYTTINGSRDLVDFVVSQVTQAVTSTMGPNGQLALIEVGGGSVKTTKDGVTVAKSLKFDDPRHEVISRVIIEPAVKTDTECGDGTTTTIFLTNQFYQLFLKYQNYVDRQFIESFVGKLIDRLKEKALRVERGSDLLRQVALTSSNNDVSLTDVVVGIYNNSDRFPQIELKENNGIEDRIVTTEDRVLRMSMSNPSFSATANGMDTKIGEYVAFLIDGNLATKSKEETLAFVEFAARVAVGVNQLKRENVTVLFIARNVDHDFNTLLMELNAAARNTGHHLYSQIKGVRFMGVHTNMGGSIGTLLMQDLSVTLNADMFSSLDQLYVANVDLAKGIAGDLVVGTHRSTLGNVAEAVNQNIAKRIKELEVEIQGYQLGERFSPKARLTERRMRDLDGGLVTIFVGGETYSSVRERIDRFEDVVKATRSAIENGVLPGVGTSMITAFEAVRGEYPNAGQLDTHRFNMIIDLMNIAWSQYEWLMGPTVAPGIETGPDIIAALAERMYVPEVFEQMELKSLPPLVLNLSTGQIGEADELGIYDTAYAAITALKGSVQTAKILASTSCVLIGHKGQAVRV